jgi:hypothetical protein
VTRFEALVLMAREAEEGKGRLRGELATEYAGLRKAHGVASIHAVGCFGAAIGAFGAAADGNGATAFAGPVVEGAIAEPGDGRYPRDVAMRVVVVEGLPDSLYALAARAAIAASQARPEDSAVTDLLSYALWKAGQRDEAMKAAERVPSGPFSLAVRASAGDLGAKAALKELLDTPAWKWSEVARTLRKIAG